MESESPFVEESGPSLRRMALVPGAWIVVALVSASQVYLASRSMGHEATFGAVLWWTAPVWLFWVLLTPGVIVLGRRFPLERGSLSRSLPVHAVVAVIFATIHLAWWLAWTQRVSPYAIEDRSLAEMMWLYVQARFNVSFLVYWAVLGAWHAVAYSRRWRQSELDASRLESRLAQARLQALRAQIHPHFLFNTLNAISSLVTRDPGRARELIARLSDLLRLSLEREADQEITLRDELEHVEVYLDIEQTRLGERLRIEFEVDPETLDARVPNLVLQPLVENAVRHGIGPLGTAGRLSVHARRADGRLELRVENDAPAEAMADGDAGRVGVGLGNTRERLAELYGRDHELSVTRTGKGTVLAFVEIPYRSADGEKA